MATGSRCGARREDAQWCKLADEAEAEEAALHARMQAETKRAEDSVRSAEVASAQNSRRQTGVPARGRAMQWHTRARPDRAEMGKTHLQRAHATVTSERVV